MRGDTRVQTEYFVFLCCNTDHHTLNFIIDGFRCSPDLNLERIPAQAGILDFLWSVDLDRRICFQFPETAVLL